MPVPRKPIRVTFIETSDGRVFSLTRFGRGEHIRGVVEGVLLGGLAFLLFWLLWMDREPPVTPTPVLPHEETCQECPACPVCPEFPPEIPPEEFWKRAMVAARAAGASEAEVRDMELRWHKESRGNPKAVSPKGALGICQGHIPSHKWIDPVRMMTEPEYAGPTCLILYRETMVCGKDWECCYLRGRSGCRDYLRERGIRVRW